MEMELGFTADDFIKGLVHSQPALFMCGSGMGSLPVLRCGYGGVHL